MYCGGGGYPPGDMYPGTGLPAILKQTTPTCRNVSGSIRKPRVVNRGVALKTWPP